MVDYENEEFDRVLISLEKIAGFMPENPVVNYYFGSTYLKLGSFNVSLKYF